MIKNFGILPSGQRVSAYTISCAGITATVTDYGATLVSLLVPDRQGNLADVVLGYDDCNGYRTGHGGFLGATVGRNANRLKDGRFSLNGKDYQLPLNDNGNNLHSGPDAFAHRLWQLVSLSDTAVTLALDSPHGDQGFPGNARIQVTYSLEGRSLVIHYRATCDRDTVFNMTNHAYFNLAGQDKPERAMEQFLTIPGRFFLPDDAANIPTGEMRSVEGTPMDFRNPKPIGRDIGADYDPLKLQGGYDHCWEVFCNPCAYLEDPVSGRAMAVSTDCPGIQLYAGNFLEETGKGGISYGKRSGVALETQFYPDALHHPQWPQPITRRGETYESRTIYRFSW